MTDSIGTVWAYRQATQDCRNAERLDVWKAKRERHKALAFIGSQQQQAKPSPEYMRYMNEALRPVVTPRDVERMVEQDDG